MRKILQRGVQMCWDWSTGCCIIGSNTLSIVRALAGVLARWGSSEALRAGLGWIWQWTIWTAVRTTLDGTSFLVLLGRKLLTHPPPIYFLLFPCKSMTYCDEPSSFFVNELSETETTHSGLIPVPNSTENCRIGCNNNQHCRRDAQQFC